MNAFTRSASWNGHPGARLARAGSCQTRAVPIYHLALRADWDDAVAAGCYRVSTVGATIDEVGFIHASREDAAAGDRAALLRRPRPAPLVVLVLDRDRLEAGGVPVVDDPVGEDTFPHLYAALPVGLVDEVRPARWSAGTLAC